MRQEFYEIKLIIGTGQPHHFKVISKLGMKYDYIQTWIAYESPLC